MEHLWTTWRSAAETQPVDDALRKLYCDLDERIAARNPTCNQSGRCCRFDTFDHLLYVTGLEIAWFTVHVKKDVSNTLLPILNIRHEDACVYQIDGLCSAHMIRPLGCRVFFCEAGTEAWQQDVYEDFLAQLKVIHERFDLPYRYMEWRAGLADCFS